MSGYSTARTHAMISGTALRQGEARADVDKGQLWLRLWALLHALAVEKERPCTRLVTLRTLRSPFDKYTARLAISTDGIRALAWLPRILHKPINTAELLSAFATSFRWQVWCKTIFNTYIGVHTPVVVPGKRRRPKKFKNENYEMGREKKQHI